MYLSPRTGVLFRHTLLRLHGGCRNLSDSALLQTRIFPWFGHDDQKAVLSTINRRERKEETHEAHADMISGGWNLRVIIETRRSSESPQRSDGVMHVKENINVNNTAHSSHFMDRTYTKYHYKHLFQFAVNIMRNRLFAGFQHAESHTNRNAME